MVHSSQLTVYSCKTFSFKLIAYSLQLIAVIFLCLFASPAAQAAEYYINPLNGLDSNSGLTESFAWKTINKVQSTSQPNDTIIIRNMDASLTNIDWPDRIYVSDAVSQFGITWTFDKDYQIGQFANHDMWVLRPVVLVSISPKSIQQDFSYVLHKGVSYKCIKSHFSASESEPGFGKNWTYYWILEGQATTPWVLSTSYHDDRIINGSMFNPQPTSTGSVPQGFDDALLGGCIYDHTKNVGFGISSLIISSPVTLASSISADVTSGRYYLKTVALLTVLDAPAPAGSFRPYYNTTDKFILFNESTVLANSALLQNLDISDVSVAISGAANHLEALHKDALDNPSDINETVERYFERPWLLFNYGPNNSYFAPFENCKEYSRDYSEQIGVASLMLNSDLSGGGKTSFENKKTLLIRFIQAGIDFYGVASSAYGRNIWKAAAGHTQGAKWPIMFAGIMLNYDSMKNIGLVSGDYVYGGGNVWPSVTPLDYIHFGEDDQTFYVGDDQIYNTPYSLYCYHESETGVNGDVTSGGMVTVTKGSKVVTLANDTWNVTAHPAYWKAIVFKTGDGVINQYARKYYIQSIDTAAGILEMTEPYEGVTASGLSYAIAEKIWYGHGNASDNTVGNEDYPEYLESHRGMPEWGERHGGKEDFTWFMSDTPNWTRQYRLSGTANSFTGFVLSALIMGQKDSWNHNALFDYMDRFIQVQQGLWDTAILFPDEKYYGYTTKALMMGDYKDGDLIRDLHELSYITKNSFVYDMWKKYRANYGPIWPDKGVVMYGDISADSVLSAYDAALAARIAVGLDAYPTGDNLTKADVSGDGFVTAYDAALIAQKAVGLITKFPVES
jgi:hypothetical protein